MADKLTPRTPCEAEAYVLRSFVLACSNPSEARRHGVPEPTPELMRAANMALESAYLARSMAEREQS